MSDTLDFLADNNAANASDNTDIDLEALEANLHELSHDELVSIMGELGLRTEDMTDDELRNATNDFIAVQRGDQKARDITHVPKAEFDFDAPGVSAKTADDIRTGGADTPLVESDSVNHETDDNGNYAITNEGKRFWTNPYTGNNVSHGSADIDGRRNINGFAVDGPAPNPIGSDIPHRGPVYPSDR